MADLEGVKGQPNELIDGSERRPNVNLWSVRAEKNTEVSFSGGVVW
jgi:hypothetical protein